MGIAIVSTLKCKNSSVQLQEDKLRLNKFLDPKVLQKLISMHEEKGYLTYQEVRASLINSDAFDENQLSQSYESLLEILDDQGIVPEERTSHINYSLSNTDPAPSFSSLPPPSLLEKVEAEQNQNAMHALEQGFTADPIRIYMREMSNVDLLSHQDEIEIAKRMEEAYRDILLNLSQYLPILNIVEDAYQKVISGAIKLSNMIVGFAEELPNATIHYSNEDDKLPLLLETDEVEDILDKPLDQQSLLLQLEELIGLKKAVKSEEGMEKLAHFFASFKWAPAFLKQLLESINERKDYIKRSCFELEELCVTKGGLPRPLFVNSFNGNESNNDWVNQNINANATY
jgi:RNA polymerase primary sigma factor